jgi:phage baseplate assembly protein W/LysM repeat protein
MGDILSESISSHRFSAKSIHGYDTKAARQDMVDVARLPFLFEVQDKDGKRLYDFVLPLAPENYDFQWQPRANITMTQGGVYQDVIGVSTPKITINGTFGFSGTTVVGASAVSIREGMGKGFSALDMYLEMETMLLDFYTLYGSTAQTVLKGSDIATDSPAAKYSKLLGKEGNQGRILFFNFTDRHYYEVQIDNFKLTRSVQRRQLYQYSLQMTCVQSIDAFTANGLFYLSNSAGESLKAEDAAAALKAASKLAAFMSAAYTGMAEVVSECNQAEALIGEISSAVATFTNAITTLIQAPFDVVQSALAAVNSITSSLITLSNIADIPHELISDLRNTKRLLMGYERQQDLFVSPTVGATVEPTAEIAGEILSVPVTGAMLSAGFTAPGIPEETLFVTADTVSVTASKQQVVTDRDTIYTVAQQHGTDWKKVAMLNDLSAPYQLSAGMVLLIPSVAGGGVSVTAKTQESFESRLFSTDEKLDENGFIVAYHGSIATTQGVNNLTAQLRHRLATQRGELAEIMHPDYGCDLPIYIGKPNTNMWIRRAMLEFKNVMLNDSRVASVGRVTTEVIDTKTYLTADVYPVGQTSAVEVSHPFA